MSVGRNSLLGRKSEYTSGGWVIWSLIVFPMFAKNVLKPLAISCLLFVSLFPVTNSSFCLLWFGCLFSTSQSICHVRLTLLIFRPWHWLCACWPGCLFEAVGPVRATTIYFPLAQGASVFFLVLRMPQLFLLGIGKTRKATLICPYFSLYIGLMYKSVQLHAWNHKFPPRKHLGHYMFLGGQWFFWGASGFSDSLAPRASGCHSPMSRPDIHIKYVCIIFRFS